MNTSNKKDQVFFKNFSSVFHLTLLYYLFFAYYPEQNLIIQAFELKFLKISKTRFKMDFRQVEAILLSQHERIADISSVF